MVLASRTPRCSGNQSLILLWTRHAALLALISWAAAFTSTVAAQESVGEIDAIGVDGNSEGIPNHSKINLLSGSSIQAGLQPATIYLKRGGKILVCPGTNLAITASVDGRGLVFQLESGNLELDYPLTSVTDSLVTPRLRLTLPGPGTLHQAVGVNLNGDTCVQSQPANRTWVVVSDPRSDAIYQIRSDAAVEFKGGRISSVEPTGRNCGCPSSPNDVANRVPVEKSGPTVPTPQPQRTAAKDDRQPDTPSNIRAIDSSAGPATLAKEPRLQNPDSPSVGHTQSDLTNHETSLLPQAVSGCKEIAKSRDAHQTSGLFTVQVGSFRVKVNADRLAESLGNKHYPVAVREVSDSSHRIWYVVCVGKYENRSLADSVAAALASEENLGLKPIVHVL